MQNAANMERETRQRRMILEAVRGLKTHPTAGDVYNIVRKKMPNISLGTVYRNLEHLARSGKIKRIEMTGCPKRFDGTISRHHHIRCEGCGAVGDIDLDPAPQIIDAIRDAHDFKVTGHRIEFTGLCQNCQKTKGD